MDKGFLNYFMFVTGPAQTLVRKYVSIKTPDLKYNGVFQRNSFIKVSGVNIGEFFCTFVLKVTLAEVILRDHCLDRLSD